MRPPAPCSYFLVVAAVAVGCILPALAAIRLAVMP